MLPRRLPKPDEGHPVDETIRLLLAPDRAVVERLRGLALRPAAGGSGRGREGRPALLLLPVLLLAALGALLLARGRVPPPAPLVPVIELRATEPAAFTIHNTGGVVTVTAPDGRIRALVAGG